MRPHALPTASFTPRTHVGSLTPALPAFRMTNCFKMTALEAAISSLSSGEHPNTSCNYDRLTGEHALEHQPARNQIRCSCGSEPREPIDVLEDRRVSGEYGKRYAPQRIRCKQTADSSPRSE